MANTRTSRASSAPAPVQGNATNFPAHDNPKAPYTKTAMKTNMASCFPSGESLSNSSLSHWKRSKMTAIRAADRMANISGERFHGHQASINQPGDDDKRD